MKMTKEVRSQLDTLATEMITESQDHRDCRIFSASGFAKENISILHQQMRCINLAWALRHTKRVKPGNVVAIIGGSFSGLMLAVALAISEDTIVYIFEENERLLHNFRDKSHRYLSPNLNSRYLGKNFDPRLSNAFFESPIFQWSEGTASDVAASWMQEFARYEPRLPIFSFLGRKVESGQITATNTKIIIDLRSKSTPHVHPIEVDLLIDATGFGHESNPHKVADFSYWESGHRLIYDHLRKPSRVLVSGCGDSGVIEALHYAFADFRHQQVMEFWPANFDLAAMLDVNLEDAKLSQVLKSSEVEQYDGNVISEICWWLNARWHLERNSRTAWSLLPDERPIFKKIEGLLEPHLEAHLPGHNLTRIPQQEREAFVCSLPMLEQLKMRDAIRGEVEMCISRRLAHCANEIPIDKIFYMKKVMARVRRGVKVTLNGIAPTPYTHQLSTYNVWLLRILMSLPNVTYRQGRICDIRPFADGKSRVLFQSGKPLVVDRVVTRYGSSNSEQTKVAEGGRRDPHHGDWLLTKPQYHVPTKDRHIFQRIEPAIDDIRRNIDRVTKRKGSRKTEILIKDLYELRVLFGTLGLKESDSIYQDSQAWLCRKLHEGIRPAYDRKNNTPR